MNIFVKKLKVFTYYYIESKFAINIPLVNTHDMNHYNPLRKFTYDKLRKIRYKEINVC